MSDLERMIAEAVALEAARDKAALAAKEAEETKKFFKEKSQREYRDDVVYPTFNGLDAMLKAQDPPHHVTVDEMPDGAFVATIRGEGETGPIRLAVKLNLEKDDRAPGFLRVHGQVHRGDGWADEPTLSGVPHKLDVEQLSRRVVVLWVNGLKPPRPNSW